MQNLKKYLIAGLLTWLPLAVTVWIMLWMVGILDDVAKAVLSLLLAITPDSAQSVLHSLGDIPGLGAVVVFILLILTGALVTNVAGRWWVQIWDALISRIPIVKPIYNSVKKVSNTLFSSNGQAFRKALLVQFPREGSWTIAFQTGTPSGEVAGHLHGDFISIYVPTTPNPTGGYFLLMPVKDVIELDMSVDAALTYIISMGAVAPSSEMLQEVERKKIV